MNRKTIRIKSAPPGAWYGGYIGKEIEVYECVAILQYDQKKRNGAEYSPNDLIEAVPVGVPFFIVADDYETMTSCWWRSIKAQDTESIALLSQPSYDDPDLFTTFPD